MADNPYTGIRKIKLIKLYEILQRDSDEQHPLSAVELSKKLTEINIPCNSEVVKRDIKVLNSSGFEVMSVMVGHEKAFYMADRAFSVPELKILIDAVQAASFITEKKTKELTSKIASLGGGFRADILENNIICFNTRKHSNETIYYIVETLEQALLNKNKVSFYYFDLDENGNQVYRKDKKLYVVNPMALIYHEDNYYLMTYNTKHASVTNYRVDRMKQVEIEEESIDAEAENELKKIDVGEYTERVFKMYGGDGVRVTLQFTNDLIGVVYDKFGEKVNMTRTGEDTLVAKVKVQVSPTFFGWLFQFEDKMRILSPKSLIAEYNKRLDKSKG